MTAANNTTTPPILVLGLGNILLKDEGIGGVIINQLTTMDLSPDVELLDGGTFGFELLSYVEDRKKIIIIDAVNGNKEPGTIYKFKADDITALKKSQALSSHQSGFYSVFKVLEFTKSDLPDIVVIGIQPADITMGTDLTPAIAEKVPAIITLVLEETTL